MSSGNRTTKSPVLIECSSNKHPTRTAKIDTFEWTAAEWSGESEWRGRFARYSRDSVAVDSYPSVRHTYVDDDLIPHTHHVLRCRLCKTTARVNATALDQLLDTLAERGQPTFPLNAIACLQQ